MLLLQLFVAITLLQLSSAYYNHKKVGGVQSLSKKETTMDASKYPIYCTEEVMSQKAHGTCETAVMKNLRWACDYSTADRICCYNRHYAEYSGYWLSTNFLKEVNADSGEITFYDSVSGKPLFIAPRGRTFQEFVDESKSHGWPSFRDQEVVWENVRCLDNGEAVSLVGTHLGSYHSFNFILIHSIFILIHNFS